MTYLVRQSRSKTPDHASLFLRLPKLCWGCNLYANTWCVNCSPTSVSTSLDIFILRTTVLHLFMSFTAWCQLSGSPVREQWGSAAEECGQRSPMWTSWTPRVGLDRMESEYLTKEGRKEGRREGRKEASKEGRGGFQLVALPRWNHPIQWVDQFGFIHITQITYTSKPTNCQPINKYCGSYQCCNLPLGVSCQGTVG